jgi:glycerol kinase
MTTALKAVLLGDAMIPVPGFEQAWRKYLGTFGEDLVVGDWEPDWGQLQFRRLEVEKVGPEHETVPEQILASGTDAELLAGLFVPVSSKVMAAMPKLRIVGVCRAGLRANPYFSAPKMMWFAQEEPDIYRSAAKLIGVQDYILFLLTGHFVTDWTQAARTMLLNIHDLTWETEVLAASGIDPAKLADLVPPGTSVEGGLRRSIAKAVNLPEGLPVIIGGGDQQCAALALNVISAGHAEANTGTGSFAIAHANRPVHHPEHRVLCSASAMPGKWINSGATYRWFRDLLGGSTITSYEELNEAAASSPVGANGVVMLPHFEGSAAPNWNTYAKGLFFNLSIGTTRGDICRAILEGIALELTENLHLMESMIGELESLSVAGGMARSDLFNQIQADALDRPVVRYENAEASSLGAVMSAMVTLGIAETYEAAFAAVASARRVIYVPDPSAHNIYSEVGNRRRKLYDALDSREVYQEFSTPLG